MMMTMMIEHGECQGISVLTNHFVQVRILSHYELHRDKALKVWMSARTGAVRKGEGGEE